MTVTFITPTTFDFRSITLFGVNSKPNSGAIGYFGTGLKYAIAVLMREEQSIHIISDNVSYEIKTAPIQFRNKNFESIQLWKAGEYLSDLPFTTELGKNWNLQNAYRELWSNTMDEQGEISDAESIDLESSNTYIFINGELFDRVHTHRYDFLLDPKKKLLWSNSIIEVYEGGNTPIYYKGIGVYSPDYVTTFTYNILAATQLTEDRTLYAPWRFYHLLTETLTKALPKDLVVKALSNENSFENKRFEEIWGTPSEDFCNAVEYLEQAFPKALSPNARASFYKARKELGKQFKLLKYSPQETTMQEAALKLLAKAGYEIYQDIILVETLGEHILARALEGKIYLTPEVFESRFLLLQALLEEYFHLEFSMEDASIRFQNFLFEQLISKITE